MCGTFQLPCILNNRNSVKQSRAFASLPYAFTDVIPWYDVFSQTSYDVDDSLSTKYNEYRVGVGSN